MIERDFILLTGFGPFPGMPINASGELARRLAAAARERFPNHGFVAEVLPVAWEAAPRRLAALLDKTHPVLALHFGVSRSAEGFVIETAARNAADKAEDACGASPLNGCVMERGVASLPATVPAKTIVARLTAAGLPARISNDAGGYLCNALLYHSLCHAAASPSRIVGFVHIPAHLAIGIAARSVQSADAPAPHSSSFPRRREPRSARHKDPPPNMLEWPPRLRRVDPHHDLALLSDLGSRLRGNDGKNGLPEFIKNPGAQGSRTRSAPALLNWDKAIVGGLLIIETCLNPMIAAPHA